LLFIPPACLQPAILTPTTKSNKVEPMPRFHWIIPLAVCLCQSLAKQKSCVDRECWHRQTFVLSTCQSVWPKNKKTRTPMFPLFGKVACHTQNEQKGRGDAPLNHSSDHLVDWCPQKMRKCSSSLVTATTCLDLLYFSLRTLSVE